MTTPMQAISVDVSQTPAILAAIYDIGLNHAGIPFIGGKMWTMPEESEVADAGGLPFWVVLTPLFAGGASFGRMQGQELPRTAGLSEPVSDFPCYALYPHRSAKNPATFSTPEDAKNKLVQAFTTYFNLQGTCAKCKIISPQVLYKMEFTDAHRQPYTAVKLTIRAFELLNAIYTASP